MNKFRFYFILSIVAAVFFSCTPSTTDDVVSVPLRDFSEQFAVDNALIETYLNTHYIKFTDTSVKFTDPDFADKDFTLVTITDPTTQVSLMSYLGKDTFPKLVMSTCYVVNVKHQMYSLILREGVNERPCNVDGVYAAYKGELLGGGVFDSSNNSENLFNLYDSQSGIRAKLLRGWSVFFPLIKSGSYKRNDDGTLSYSNYGVGVMFLPSGLAYYDISTSSSSGDYIDQYSPLIFTVKLFGVKRNDQDNDGIPSYLEDLNGDNYLYANTGLLSNNLVSIEDTDGDGVANFLDLDDDGDGINTKTEIKNTTTGLYYDFDFIPGCDGKNTDPARIKRHLVKCN